MNVIDLISKTILEIEKMKSFETDSYTLTVLNDCFNIVVNLKKEFIIYPENVKIETLKKSKILGMYAFKVFENSPLENMFNDIIEYLWDNFPIYKTL